MATITERPRADGSIGYTAQITKKSKGRIVYRKAQTFDTKRQAKAWAAKVEKEIATEAGIRAAKAQSGDMTVAEAIDRYLASYGAEIGRTKAQCLTTLKSYPVAEMQCADLAAPDFVKLAETLRRDRSASTVTNYMSHFAAVLRVARTAWGVPISKAVVEDGREGAKMLRLTAKSRKRDRRPTVDEMSRFMAHFARSRRGSEGTPMGAVAAFALFSGRRQDEITRIRWADYEGDRVLVRDMKNPGEKIGNNVWCELPPEAARIIDAQPRTDERIFPYNSRTISTMWTRAGHVLGLSDINFHDLRHECASRLLEMGWSIPHAARVTGHRSWSSLQRYSHVRQIGDKWAGWEWLDRIAPLETQKSPPPANG